jgi:hypothetical protein
MEFWTIIPIKEYFIVGKFLSLTIQEGHLIVIQLLVIGSYLLSLICYGMKSLEELILIN